MSIRKARELISHHLDFEVIDKVFFLCTDKDDKDYYLVYENHKPFCVESIDKMTQSVALVMWLI